VLRVIKLSGQFGELIKRRVDADGPNTWASARVLRLDHRYLRSGRSRGVSARCLMQLQQRPHLLVCLCDSLDSAEGFILHPALIAQPQPSAHFRTHGDR
jgi:hypothetical protein